MFFSLWNLQPIFLPFLYLGDFLVLLYFRPQVFFFFNCLFFPSYRSNPIILLPVLHIGICLIRYFFLTSYLKKVYIL